MRTKILTRFFQQAGLLGLLFVMACSGEIEIKSYSNRNTDSTTCSSDCPALESVSPRAAAPGTKITVSGKNLGGKRTFLVGETALTPLDRSDSELSFLMPEGKNGYLAIEIKGGGALASQTVYRLTSGSYPIITLDAGLVCSDIVFYNAAGEITSGTKDCEVLSEADKGLLKPENIKAGVTISTVTGTLASGMPPKSCSTAGETDCMATSTFWGALTSGIAGKILAGESIAGVAGTLTLPPASAVRVSAGAYGPDGNALTPLLADCGSNGQADCVANSTYKAADLSNLSAANIKAGATIAGQAGAYPSATYPLTGADATNDLAGFGPAVATGTYEFFNSAGARYTGILADGGTITPGTSNQTVSAANTFYRQLIVAGDSDLAAVNIKDAITVFGVTGVLTGAPSNCTADGQDNCLIDGTNYKAAAVTGAANKILAGQTLAGIAGTITLPAVGKVLTATSYGVGGNGSTGTLTLPAAANVLTGSGAYGEPGSQLTPVYSPDFPSLGNVRTIDTVNGASGTLADCGSDGSVGCVVVGPTYAALLKTGAQDKILSGNTIGSVSGNVTLPAVTKVLTATSYGVGGNGSTGTLTLPSAANVLTGSGAYGEPGTQLTPAYSPDFPDVSNVLSSDTVNSTSGTLTLPPVSRVLLSTSYGVAGTGSTGTLTLPTAGNVLSGSGTYGDTSALITPTLSLPATGRVLSGINFGVSGTGSTGTLTLPAAGAVRSSAGAYGDPGSTVTGTISDCTANGSDCYVPAYVVTTQPLKAISYDAINAGKASMRSSLTLSGIAGTLADCSANNAADCVTTATYKSADWTNLTAANIKNGVSVAGLTGTYPSSGNLLSGADSTADLDLATLDAKLKSSSSFEWWGPSGTRYTASGDGDIVEANVKSGVTIFGATGTYSGATIPSDCSADAQVGCITTASYPAVNTTALSPWDIRMGKTAGGVAGSISFYKNMAATAFYNRTSGTGAAAGLDVYDTIDDVRNSGAFPTEANAGWDQATGASWIRDSVSDTGAGGGTAADGLCNGTEECVYKDRITGVFWARATATTRTWEATISYCDGLSYGTYSDWRVPTQKEMQQGYIDGIWTQAAASRLNLSYNEYWTATTISDDTTQAWVNYPAQGDTSWNSKTGPARVVCVR